MGKTVALRVTRGERRAFFKRRGQDLRFTLTDGASTGEEFAQRRRMRPVAPPLAEPEPDAFEAGFSALGRALDKAG